MSFAAITGWGMAVPERAVTNAELARRYDGIDEEWIVARTGIRERRIAADGETTSTLAASAGRQALWRAGLDADELDLVVVATCTPDRPIPATAPLVQHALGATRAGAFDVNAACAGFLTALAAVSAMVRGGQIERALVIGAEVLSRSVDWTDHKSCVLFGDGAGAAVLERSDESAGLLSLSMGASGAGASMIEVRAGGSARPASQATLDAREHLIKMNGPEVYRAAVRIMSEAAADALRRARTSVAEVDLLIVHQANDRIITEVGARIGIPSDKVFSNVAGFGNTSAASVPIAICSAADRGLLRPGDRVLLSAVGAGLTWAAGVAVWTGAATRRSQGESSMVGAHA